MTLMVVPTIITSVPITGIFATTGTTDITADAIELRRTAIRAFLARALAERPLGGGRAPKMLIDFGEDHTLSWHYVVARGVILLLEAVIGASICETHRR
jgi:hypothetical protein